MPRYDFKCNVCGTVVEVTSLPGDLTENWPICPTEGCTGKMGRVWTSLVTIWKTSGSTKSKKRGLPDVR